MRPSLRKTPYARGWMEHLSVHRRQLGNEIWLTNVAGPTFRFPLSSRNAHRAMGGRSRWRTAQKISSGQSQNRLGSGVALRVCGC